MDQSYVSGDRRAYPRLDTCCEQQVEPICQTAIAKGCCSSANKIYLEAYTYSQSLRRFYREGLL
jgi:hypothetical protein